MEKKKFEQEEVNEFFEESKVAGRKFLVLRLQTATTEKERKRIKRLLKDFS